MFDEAWYRNNYDLIIHDDPLADYFANSQADLHRASRSPVLRSLLSRLASRPRYAPPSHSLCSDRHKQGWSAIHHEKANSFLDSSPLTKLAPLGELLGDRSSVAVLYWADGNFFFQRHRALYCGISNWHGLRCSSLHRRLCRSTTTATTLLVVAPHEYCAYGPGKLWAEERAASAIYVNTEQWHTSWFALAFAALRRSGRVLDINPAAAAAFARLGMRAGFLLCSHSPEPVSTLIGRPFPRKSARAEPSDLCLTRPNFSIAPTTSSSWER
jgi:hypothetical protein